MAKKSSVEKNEKRKLMAAAKAATRAKLKARIYDKTISVQERFESVLQLAQKPRNSAKTRVRNRCAITGRPRGYYRHFGLSRNMLREYAGMGLLPGVIRSSW